MQIQKNYGFRVWKWILAEILLKSYPEAIAILIDHSEPMIENAQINMKDYIERCEIINGDFSKNITEYADRGTVDCIVSDMLYTTFLTNRKEYCIAKYLIY